MCNLGTLDGGSWSNAYGVNADGTVVVGYSYISGIGSRAFRWVEGEGMESLGTLDGGSGSLAWGVSDDGTVVVGESGSSGGTRAFRWVEGEGMESLGTLDGGSSSRARGVNADGTVVVGEGGISGGETRAFRWVEGGNFGGANPEMQNLGTLAGGNWSSARGVNADGTVVVGYSYISGGGTHAFRWVEGDGMESLGTFVGGSSSRAYGVSDDGTVVVGYSGRSGGDRAFRWVEGDGMESLGTLDGGGYSEAYGVNADGTVVVGQSDSSDGERAFRWVEGEGMESLGTLDGGSWSRAQGVSADGTVVVGESGSSDGWRAFIWRGVMEDFENLITSFPVLGNDSAVALAEQQFALGQVMSQGGVAAAGQTVIAAHGGGQHTGRNPTSVGARTTSLAALSFGRGISETLTLGATLSLSGTSLQNNAFDMGTGFGAALWGQYSAGGMARTGLQLSAAVGYGRAEGEIARGRLLTGVVLATGTSTVETRAVQASVGYGLQQGDWLLTPSLGLAHFNTSRAAYTESGAAFNASYDEMRVSQTTLTLALASEFALGAQGRMTLGAGLEHDLRIDSPRLTGTSDIPGMASFDIGSSFTPNRTRGFVSVGYTHEFGNGSSLTGNLRIGQAVYGTTPSVGVGVAYRMRF